MESGADSMAFADQQLKARLRRYEAARVPSELKKERLFEVRFFEGMPRFVLQVVAHELER